MISMGGKGWPPVVPVLTPALLVGVAVVNLLARADEQVVYVMVIYPAPGAAPCLTYGRVHPSALAPLTPEPEPVRSSP